MKIGDLYKLRGNDYMTLKVHRMLPNGLVECLANGGSTPVSFDFAIIKTFKKKDLVKETK